MAQEEKDLLLKDLCARLPYDTVVYYKTDGWESQYYTLSPQVIDNMVHRFDIVVKPYLRPMSSMTEEEESEYHGLCYPEWNNGGWDGGNWHYRNTISSIDWLNAHHFDYKGLIEKGLAITAPEGMYKEE